MMTNQYEPEKQNLAQTLSQHLHSSISPDQINLLSKRGANKLVFTIPYKNSSIVATALPREQDYDLHREYQLLKHLYQKVPEYFPSPEFYIEQQDLRILGMQYFPHSTIYEIKSELDSDDLFHLAFAVGYTLGFTYERTGYYTREPHDENILISLEPELELKLIDVDHYEQGSLRELREAVYTYRQECKEYPEEFKRGLRSGIYNAK